MTILRVLSSCRSIKPRDALAVRDFEDSLLQRQSDDYFADNEIEGQRGYVRKVDSHRKFSTMSCSSGETDRKI